MEHFAGVIAPEPPDFRELRSRGFTLLLHSQDSEGWSYAVKPRRHLLATKRELEELAVGGASGSDSASRSDSAPDFTDGWIVLAAYDFGRGLEEVADDDPSPVHVPEVVLIEAEEVVSFRANPFSGSAVSDKKPPFALDTWESDLTDERYTSMVGRAKEYIAAGDIYQVNLARWFRSICSGDPLTLFETLSTRNPSPYAVYAEIPAIGEFPPFALVSSSPELLVAVDGDRIVTRPIAGTYPRSRSIEDLPRDPKERAEHVMLVDHERNDLGRLAVPGSVKVEEFLGVESYSHLHHIVSEVSARLKGRPSLYEVLKAVFPGGTITGTPKIRAMEIIAELEPQRRSYYTGAIGYLTRRGNLKLNILIRTVIIQNGVAHLAAGAGIVADSVPEREAEETRIKAAVFLEAR